MIYIWQLLGLVTEIEAINSSTSTGICFI